MKLSLPYSLGAGLWARFGLLVATLGLAWQTHAAILTVTSIGDTIANDGACTLREAITQINAGGPAANGCSNTGAAFGTSDEIQFNISAAGVQTITPGSELPVILVPVIINGYSQPGSVANSAGTGWNGTILIELSGASAGASADGLEFVTTGSIVQGLAIYGFSENGIHLGGNLVNGNANGNTIRGNIIGLRADASTSAGNTLHGIAISALGNADSNSIGGTLNVSQRNIISGNGQNGVLINAGDSNYIGGNYIGTDGSGTAARPNTMGGIWINQGASNSVLFNVISGNDSSGVQIGGNLASLNAIQGNSIGVTPTGTPMGNASHGVLVAAPDNAIGGSSGGYGNTIAYNGGRGVAISTTGPYGGNAILGNSIHSNGGLGIDLGLDGVTANDSGDADTGPNRLQNFPVLTSADAAGAISGTLHSTAGTTFRVEFAVSASCDSSGNGEGQTYLGANNFTTDIAGNAALVFAAGAIPVGYVVTATATNNTTSDTSEFSACVTVTAVGGGQEIDITGNSASIVDGDATPSLADWTDFGTTTVGTPVTRTFTIANSGGTVLTLGANAVTLSGAGCAEFSVTVQPANAVGPVASSNFLVQYLPTNVGTDTCTVNVNNDDADENPYNFAIQGTAAADPASGAAAIPTLSPWGLGLLTGFLGLAFYFGQRRRRH